MNLIYTVSPTTHELVYYAGYSYADPPDQDKLHICNCKYCPNSPSKRLKYNFTTDIDKALLIETDDEVRGLLAKFNQENAFGVPLWIRGQRFGSWWANARQRIPTIMNDPEFYRL